MTRLPALLALLLLGCPVGVDPDEPPDESTPEPTPQPGPCDDTEALAARSALYEGWFDELADGVDPTPVDRVLDDGGNGSLSVGLNADAFALLAGPGGVHAAVTTIGDGRVVAFSGQDFLSSGDRSTLLVDSDVPALLRNAASWAAGGGSPLSILADNDAVAAVLAEGTDSQVAVTPIVEQVGLRSIRDWSAAALAGHDVAVVQINEWGTLHVADEDLPALDAFVADGGGLLIAGAAMHWSWWLWDQGPAYPGDALLGDFGISWSATSVGDMTTAELAFDALSAPEALWCAWVRGEAVDEASLPQVAPLFGEADALGRDAEVQQALTRLIDEAPVLPVSTASGAARLAADVGALLDAVQWPAGHPWAEVFPGGVPAEAERVSHSVTLDPAWTRDHPLGVYAAPGDVVTVTVPADHAGTGLSLRLGDRYDDLRGLDHIDTWRRPPLLLREVAVSSATTELGSGFGGALYLVVPDGYGGGSIEVEVEGGVPMGVFVPGVTTDAQFAADLAAGAPRAAFFEPGKVSLVVATAAAQEADAAEVLAFWTPFYDSHADLAQEPVPRTWTSHWLFDPQVGWGYANATSARINHPEGATGWALRTRTGDEDWWLFGHELGHQFQTADWSGGDVTEVCVNLWSMYTLNRYIHDGGDFETVGHEDNVLDHAALIDMRWGEAGLFDKLELYRQLVFEFGWPVYREVMASYYDPAYPRADYGSFMDGFAMRFSALAGRDITPFLQHWGYPLSGGAAADIQAWGLEPWLPPGW